MKTFRQFSNHVVTALVCGLTAAAVLLLAFVLFFIVKEALPLFDTVGVSDFLLGQKWMPVDYTGVTSFGIFNFIAATAYVSLTGLVLAAGIGLGTAMFLAFQATPRMRTVMYPLIDLLAGIPSVIYGFIGLSVLVKIVLKGGSSYRFLRAGGRYSAGGDASAISGVLLLRYDVKGEKEISGRFRSTGSF